MVWKISILPKKAAFKKYKNFLSLGSGYLNRQSATFLETINTTSHRKNEESKRLETYVFMI